MKTDIQIAQEATMLPIKDVAASIGIKEDDLELYGKYKAKISDELINRTKKNPDGKLILVTAMCYIGKRSTVNYCRCMLKCLDKVRL